MLRLLQRYVWRLASAASVRRLSATTRTTVTGVAARSHVPSWNSLAQFALPELRSTATVLRHTTGALFVDISSCDEHAYFSASFLTGVRHDRGSPHILEHVALCGSAAFNVRDPFHAMSTRSLYTDMNAATAADHTTYYFSTTNATDYGNLRTVFLDAVFRPLLRESDFRAEGVRIEPGDISAPLSSNLALRGVVYNEMQGHAASATDVLGRAVYRALLPGTCYAANAGGDPRHIPDLTYAELVSFHAERYTPQRALFVAYGALPVAPTLEAVSAALDEAAKTRTSRRGECYGSHTTSRVASAGALNDDSRVAVTSALDDDGLTAAQQRHLLLASNRDATPPLPPLLRVVLPPDADSDSAGSASHVAPSERSDAAAVAAGGTSSFAPGAVVSGTRGGPALNDSAPGRNYVLRAWRVPAVPEPRCGTTLDVPAARSGAPPHTASDARWPFRCYYRDLILRVAVDLLMAGTQSPMYRRVVASGLAIGYAPGSGADTGAGDATVLVLGGSGVRQSDADAVDAAIIDAIREAVQPRVVNSPANDVCESAHGRAASFGPSVSADGVLLQRGGIGADETDGAVQGDYISDETDDDPFSAARIEGALHAIEFSLRAPSPALGATLAGIVNERWAASLLGGIDECNTALVALTDASDSSVARDAAAALLSPLRVRELVQRLRADTIGAVTNNAGDAGAALRVALRDATLGNASGCVRIVGTPAQTYLDEGSAVEAARLAEAESTWTREMRSAAAEAAEACEADSVGDGGADALPSLSLAAIPHVAPDVDATSIVQIGSGVFGLPKDHPALKVQVARIPLAIAAASGNNGVATLRLLFNIDMPAGLLPSTLVDGSVQRPWAAAAASTARAANSRHHALDTPVSSASFTVLPPRLHVWLPIFASTALAFGTRVRAPSAWDLATRRSLGKLSASIVTASTSAHVCDNHCIDNNALHSSTPLYGLLVEAAWLADHRTPDALALLGELLAEGAAATAQLFTRDRALLSRALRAASMDAAQGAADASGSYAATAAASWLNPITALRELHGGRSQARFVLEHFHNGEDDNVDLAASAFQEIASTLFVRRVATNSSNNPIRALLTVDPEHEDRVSAAVEACLAGALPQCLSSQPPDLTPFARSSLKVPLPPRLLLRSPSHVNALAIALPAPAWGTPEHAHLSLGLSALVASRLHAQVRTRGGAYDVSAHVGTADEALITTGDDPSPRKSLAAIVRAARAAVAPGGLCEADIRGAKLAAAAELDAPMPPSARGLSRLLYGVGHESRQAHRNAVLGAGLTDVRRALDQYAAAPLAEGDFGAVIVGPIDRGAHDLHDRDDTGADAGQDAEAPVNVPDSAGHVDGTRIGTPRRRLNRRDVKAMRATGGARGGARWVIEDLLPTTGQAAALPSDTDDILER